MTRTTITIPKNVLDKGKSRARDFRLSFSAYISRLIEEDARSLRQSLTIVSENPGDKSAAGIIPLRTTEDASSYPAKQPKLKAKRREGG